MKIALAVVCCIALFIVTVFLFVIYQHIRFEIRWREIEKQRRNKDKDEGKS